MLHLLNYMKKVFCNQKHFFNQGFVNDLTIIFSGYNIKWIACLAIESFLQLYPKLRSNVLYFDDESTDNTCQELEKRGVRCITWKYYKEDFLRFFDSDLCIDNHHAMCVRCLFIIKDILKQCSSQYVLVSDGDVVFLKGGFLEYYCECFSNGAKVVAHLECAKSPNIGGNDNSKFMELIKHEDGFVRYPRIHFMHTALDVGYFKEIGLIGDGISQDILSAMTGHIADVGSDFYYEVKKRNIPSIFKDYKFINGILHHWGWLSSSNRSSVYLNPNSARSHLTEIMDVLYGDKKGILNICQAVNIDPMDLIDSYCNTKSKGNIV